MNGSTELWSQPWHGRLKNLADSLRGEGAVHAAVAARQRAARLDTARVVAMPTGSWMIRARSQAIVAHPGVR